MDRNLQEDNTDRYVDYINEHILNKIDYDKLQSDYATKEKIYAKSVLNALHKAAIVAYGTEYFDGFDENEYVLLPGVIRSKEKGNMCIGLLEIDLQSSGEHFNTDFLLKFGCMPQFDAERPEALTKFLFANYANYEYAYTLGIETDHHVDFETLHPDITEFLNTFENYEFKATENVEMENDDIER